MRSIRLLFVNLCAVYRTHIIYFVAANKANNKLILPFQLNQVKTYEKGEKSKKAIWTRTSKGI